MTTQKQIEANRANARRSTGPKSAAGKRRSRKNAYRHGFAAMSSAEFAQEVDRRAQEIAGGQKDPITLEYARQVADADVSLQRVRQSRAAWIQRTYVTGCLTEPHPHVEALQNYRRTGQWNVVPADLIHPRTTMPASPPERLAEAIRRALPVLTPLDRYETRAAGRRERALARLERRKIKNVQNEPNFMKENQ